MAAAQPFGSFVGCGFNRIGIARLQETTSQCALTLCHAVLRVLRLRALVGPALRPPASQCAPGLRLWSYECRSSLSVLFRSYSAMMATEVLLHYYYYYYYTSYPICSWYLHLYTWNPYFSRVYGVATVLYLQIVLLVMLFRMSNYYYYVLWSAYL